MYIVDQDRKSVVNTKNVSVVYIDGTGNMIMADFIKDAGSDCLVLGRYNKQRTEEVFIEMLKNAFQPRVLSCNNTKINSEDLKAFYESNEPMIIHSEGQSASVQIYDVGVYYMPEV